MLNVFLNLKHFLINVFFIFFFTGFLLFLSIFVFTNALRAIDNSLSSDDNARLKQVFLDGFKSNDIQAVYFGALNLKELSAQEKNSACSRLPSLYSESKLNVSFSSFRLRNQISFSSFQNTIFCYHFILGF